MPSLRFALSFAFLIQSSCSQNCVEMYTQAFKGKKQVSRDEVGGLYFTWCKKNMKVSSAKSMDEMCRPIVKKVEEKMIWVPGDAKMTPDLVCKNVEQLKAEFPEHAKVAMQEAESRQKEAKAEEQAKELLNAKAKALRAAAAAEVTALTDKAVLASLRGRLQERFAELLDVETAHSKKLLDGILDSLAMGLRGLETKSNQKTDELLKAWLTTEVKTAAAAKKDEL